MEGYPSYRPSDDLVADTTGLSKRFVYDGLITYIGYFSHDGYRAGYTPADTDQAYWMAKKIVYDTSGNTVSIDHTRKNTSSAENKERLDWRVTFDNPSGLTYT